MDPKKSDNTNNTTTGVELVSLVDVTVPKPTPKLERPEPINLDDVVDATTNVDTPIDVDGPEHDDTKKRKLKLVVWNHFSKQKIKGSTSSPLYSINEETIKADEVNDVFAYYVM
ncbi:hypothetical protein Q3G72_005934 [Acer saccharum]|nr:hypothetical protein Q3G72_005934 [Acer saccharum]